MRLVLLALIAGSLACSGGVKKPATDKPAKKTAPAKPQAVKKAPAEPTIDIPPLPQTSTVDLEGTLRAVVEEGHRQGTKTLAGMVNMHSVAVGLMDGLAGLVTVVDNQVWFATPKGVEVVVPKDLADQKALTLTKTIVPAWEPYKLPDAVPADDLGSYIETQLKQRNRGGITPLLYRGSVRDLIYRVTDASQVGDKQDYDSFADAGEAVSLEKQLATLVIFHSKDHGGKATLPNEDMIIHVVGRIEGEPFSGRVERAGLSKGARLWFPKR